jgi:hypothetical protein
MYKMIFMYTNLIAVHGVEISHVVDVAGERQDIFKPAATTSNPSIWSQRHKQRQIAWQIFRLIGR